MRRHILTPYERGLLTYQPDITYIQDLFGWVENPSLVQSMRRSLDYQASVSLVQYDELLSRLYALQEMIQEEVAKDIWKDYQDIWQTGTMEERIAFEKGVSTITGERYIEVYTILERMRPSIEACVLFIEEHLLPSVSDTTDREKAMEQETASINAWAKAERQTLDAYEEMDHDEEMTPAKERYIERLERETRSYELLHRSMADISYVHRNRYQWWDSFLQEMEDFLNDPYNVLEGDEKLFRERMKDVSNKGRLQAHLALIFEKRQTKHDNLKHGASMTGENKERVAQERHYFYQQLHAEGTEDMKQYLYSEEEETDAVLDQFLDVLTESVEEVSSSYEKSVADLLNFYQMEAQIFRKQWRLIQKKEELRLFHRILDDLEG